MQDKYLRNIDKTDPMDKGSDTYQMKDCRHMHKEPKTDKMSKLRAEAEFLERGMLRVRTKLKTITARPNSNTFSENSRPKTKTLHRAT